MDDRYASFRGLTRQVVRRFGYEITRYLPHKSKSGRLGTLLSFHKVDLVLDVGANSGQYALELREAGYRGRIVSFEPLSSAHQQLQQRATGHSNWIVAPRMALGNDDGQIDIHVSRNSVSSSVLPMLPAHLAAAPASEYVATERVRLARLDTIAPAYLGESRSTYLKLDTQGFESQVLDGAANTLARVNGLQLELSIVPLYDGQVLFLELIKRLEGLGFGLQAIFPGFTDDRSGRLLQFDGIFFR